MTSDGFPPHLRLRQSFQVLAYQPMIENAVTDGIQFSNAGTNSELAYEIRDTKIIGGNPHRAAEPSSLICKAHQIVAVTRHCSLKTPR